MFCIKCGFELPDEAIFCSKCGSKTVRELKHERIEDEKESLEIVLPTEAEFSNKDKYKVWKTGRIFFFFFIPFIIVAMANAEKRPNTFLIDSLIAGLIWMGILTPFFGFKKIIRKSSIFRNDLILLKQSFNNNEIDVDEFNRKKYEMFDTFVNSEQNEPNSEILNILKPLIGQIVISEKDFSKIKNLLEPGTFLLESGEILTIHGFYDNIKDSVGHQALIDSEIASNGKFTIIKNKYTFIIKNGRIVDVV